MVFRRGEHDAFRPDAYEGALAQADRAAAGDDAGAAVELDLAGSAFHAPHDAGQDVVFADEVGDEGIDRMLVDALGRVDLLDGALMEHGDAVGHGERLTLVVGDEDHGDAERTLQMFDLQLHLLAQVLVERPERLVHQDELRVEDERPGERHALLLPAGELLGVAFGVLLEADHGQRPPYPRLDLVDRKLAYPQGKAQVVGHGHVGKERIVLKDHADVAPVGRDTVDDLPAQQDLAARRRFETGEHHQRGGLARTGRAQQGQEFAAPDVEVEIAHDERGAIVGFLHADETDVRCIGACVRFSCHAGPSPGLSLLVQG